MLMCLIHKIKDKLEKNQFLPRELISAKEHDLVPGKGLLILILDIADWRSPS
jgi:hypothetical protein